MNKIYKIISVLLFSFIVLSTTIPVKAAETVVYELFTGMGGAGVPFSPGGLNDSPGGLSFMRFTPTTTITFNKLKAKLSAYGIDNSTETVNGSLKIVIQDASDDSVVGESLQFDASNILSNSGGSDCFTMGYVNSLCDEEFIFIDPVLLNASTEYVFSFKKVTTLSGTASHSYCNLNDCNYAVQIAIFGNYPNYTPDEQYMVSGEYPGGGYGLGRADAYIQLIDNNIRIISTDIATNTNLNNNHTYIISGNIEIDPGITLTIEPGTVVKFDTSTPSSLTVNGTLVAEGESNTSSEFKNIVFTSLKDDSIAFIGDTGGDGNTSGAPGEWGGITVNSGGVATFEHATVRYAGLSGTSEAQIHNDGGTVTISDESYVVHGTDYGIKNTDGVLNVSDTDIGFHDYGVYAVDGTVSLDGGNTIHDNSSYGVYNADTTTIDAENNFWGDSTGPYHATNTLGQGDIVSDYVDFTPWVTNLHFVSGHDAVTGGAMTYSYTHAIGGDYTSELADAVDTWDVLGSVAIDPAVGTPDVAIENVDQSSEFYVGGWDYVSSPTNLLLNTYYLDHDSSAQVQHTITHELGHALGLAHSYSGNIMYHNQTSQTALGTQDTRDYDYLW